MTIDALGNVVTSGYFSASKNTLVNRYYVGTKGHFQTISSAINWLTDSMTAPSELILDGGDFTIVDSIGIELPYELSFRGFSFNTTTIKSGTGLEDKPMFNIRSDVSFERFTIDGTGLAGWGNETLENAFNITKAGLYCEFRNMDIDNAYRGINLVSGSAFFQHNTVFSNCIKGVEVNTTGVPAIDIEVTNFEDCRVGIDLVDATTMDMFITTVNFVNGTTHTTDTCIKYDVTKVTWNDITTIQGNNWNRVGLFQAGFDFTNSANANVIFISNAGYEDKNPHAKINVINNLTTTTVTTTTNYYKVNYTNTSSYTCKFTVGNNRLTYQSANTRDLKIWVSGNVQVNQNSRTVDIAVVKNAGCGTSPVLVNNACLYSPMSCRLPSQNVPYPFSIVAYIPDITLNDYIEIWVTKFK